MYVISLDNIHFRAGEGQLEISINDGDVPNAVQVLGGGKCLVTYTPEEAITHEIEVTFNDEHVSGNFPKSKRAMMWFFGKLVKSMCMKNIQT